jgi:hypothetical protein
VTDVDYIWIFHGEGARFASGVFTTEDLALEWVARHRLTGVVTQYPVNAGAYDEAIANGWFRPSKPHHGTPTHVAGFSPGHTEHIHVRDGKFDDGDD